jgi:diguanylate cyclase (GGDEF)-like protein
MAPWLTVHKTFPKRPWPLRTYLYLLTIGVLLPSVFLVCWNAYSQYQQAEAAAKREAYNLAQISADNTQAFLADAEQLMRTIVRRIQAQPDNDLRCNPLFNDFKTLFPRFANLSQSTAQGFIVCSGTPQREQRNTYVGDTEWFKLVYQHKKFIIAPPYRGVLTGRMVSVLAYPITNADGIVTGALQMPIDLANFVLIPGVSKLPDSINISIIDTNGVLIARSQTPEQFIGKNLRGVDAVEKLLAIRDGTATSISSQGVGRIYGYRPIPGTDWLVAAGIATSDALKSARSTAIQNAIIGAAGLVFAAIVAFLMSKRISRPILAMQTTAFKIASGEREQRVSVNGPKEISDVAIQFNAMLDSIECSREVQAARESEIHRLAFYDLLTTLPNRRLLIQKIEEQCRIAKDLDWIGAVVYIDLDHFKHINDAYGHQAGDQFLKAVADRLSSLLRGNDILARIGSDEFVYVATALGRNQAEAVSAVMRLGSDIQRLLEENLDANGHRWITSASIGISLFPKIGDTSEILLHEADIAMYRVKQDGRNNVILFEASMRQQLTERLALEGDLRKAMTEGQFELYAQPQVDCAGTLCGAELLLRWQHPEKGFISPAMFIPLAESSDLIVEIGRWVLFQGCMAQVASHAMHPGLSISINVSPRQFRHPDFPEEVRQALATTQANPACLILEVTEGLLIDDIEGTIERMNALAEMGLRFSIDDFGTGYSSLAYLKQLPLYELKIDKSFIKDLPGDANDTAIVQSILVTR